VIAAIARAAGATWDDQALVELLQDIERADQAARRRSADA
jgi:hypothetical protein